MLKTYQKLFLGGFRIFGAVWSKIEKKHFWVLKMRFRFILGSGSDFPVLGFFNFWKIPEFCVAWFRHEKVKYCELEPGNSVIGKLGLSGFQRWSNQLLTPNF